MASGVSRKIAVCLATIASLLLFARGPSARAADAPKRIVSLIPAVTEMLFAIGAGPQVIGVSSFDHFPPDVERVTKVGALLDPDLERIISLEPDLAVVFESQTELRAQLDRARIPVYVYKDAGLPDVTRTIRDLGARVGHGREAEKVSADIESRLEQIRKWTSRFPRPRTLIVLGREPMTLRGIFVSGGVGFVHDMVVAAGAQNVFEDVKRRGLQATTEQILARRPEVVLELRGSDVRDDVARRETGVWSQLAVPAVATHRVFMLRDDRLVVPGPRVADGVRLIADTLHPRPGF